MSLMSKPSVEAKISLWFITGGMLMTVWTAIWYVYLRNHPPQGSAAYYFCAGSFLSGLVLVTIGIAVGHIGRTARRAELPPTEVTKAVVDVNQEAASRAPMIAPVNPAYPVTPTNPPTPTNPEPALTNGIVANAPNRPVPK